MRELGSEQDSQHLQLLQRLLRMNLNQVLLVGPEFAKFKEQFPSFLFFNETQDLIPALDSIFDSYVLIKGSNSNKLSSIVPNL